MKDTNILPVWWEKTVEYKFIAELTLASRLAFAAPLSGRQERTGGDLILGMADKFILIEYKRTRAELINEHSIFYNFDEARSYFQDPEHHLAIYGYLCHENKLNLEAVSYFSTTTLPTTSIVDVVDLGVPYELFMSYLRELSAFKRPYGETGGGTGGFHATSEAMSAVIGISNSGLVVGSQTLSEFAPDLFLQVDQILDYDDGLDSTPGPGMR